MVGNKTDLVDKRQVSFLLAWISVICKLASERHHRHGGQQDRPGGQAAGAKRSTSCMVMLAGFEAAGAQCCTKCNLTEPATVFAHYVDCSLEATPAAVT